MYFLNSSKNSNCSDRTYISDNDFPDATGNVPIPAEGIVLTSCAISREDNKYLYRSSRFINDRAPDKLPLRTHSVNTIKRESLDGAIPMVSNRVINNNPLERTRC